MSGALVLASVSVRIQRNVVLDGLDLRVDHGEVRALVGLNGAGKTTALRVALGMLRPDAGQVGILGESDPRHHRHVWRGVGYFIDQSACYPELTARQNISAAAWLRGADQARATRMAQAAAEALGLLPWLDIPVGRLSLGTRQKVGLVSALAHEPRLLVLDEPTNALDPLAVVAFRDLLRSAASAGAGVLVTSHHFDELARVADRVEVLHRGRMVDTIVPDGRDLERTFFETLIEAERTGGVR